jgi:anti-sigma regulatory factor (Ser/Thr protein kinase)
MDDHTMTVALSLNAPRQVRHALEERYVASMERSLLDDVTLLTSEIVTNAVQHSGRPDGDPLTVRASVVEDALRIEVTDQGLGAAPLTPRSMEPPSGLGFVQIVSDRWSSRIKGAFNVWFEINVVSRSVLYRAPV